MSGKKDKKQKSGERFKLLEGTALRNENRKNGKGKTAVFVKNWHLDYEKELKILQIELMKLQRHMQASGDRILAIFEGRDAAGKG
ncbi:MAG: polyphosphate kinase 2, partial [Desulfocapsa sp.]|nr:polyphosphate kinase 2 [Desulfocapsa sp.]